MIIFHIKMVVKTGVMSEGESLFVPRATPTKIPNMSRKIADQAALILAPKNSFILIFLPEWKGKKLNLKNVKELEWIF